MDRERQVSLGEVAHAPDPIRGLLTRRRGIQSPPSPSRPKAETSLSRLRQRCAPRVRRGVGRRSVSVEMSGGRVKRERDSRPPSSSSSRSSVASRIKQEPGEERGAATTRGSRGRAASAAAAAAAVPVRVKREPDEEPRIKREPDEEVEDDDDEEPTVKYGRFDPEDRRSRHCPYLDTINKSVLDFDFEKLCSISLSHINVYACLVCGKYFQGRGLKSHAYIHSVQFSHHVFLNLHTLKFYCLPDNYEIIDSSLEDITYVLKPTFTKQHITNLDKQAKLSRAYDGTTYLPGIVGLNNIKANDYANAVLQALSNVPPLRNYFLEEENYKTIKRPPGDIMFLLVQRFGELMRKLWNPRNFKAHVSPHEMLQAVVLCSKKNFQITKQGDGVDFLSWFLNALHLALGGTKKKKKTIVTDVFQGSMRIFTKKLPHPDLPAEEKEQLLQNDEYQEKMVESTFMYLTLDLPTAPLYKDEKEQLIIPQVPLFNILAKFNGITEKEYKTYKENFLKRFQLTKLPPYLIFCIKRFTKNNFFVEKNPTIVNFPITNVDLREYLSEEVQAVHKNTTYDLIANIVHDGKPAEGAYRIHVLHHGTGKWYELQDLQVTDILPQMITLSEAYIQIWKRRDNEEETNQQGA
ncbi:U4/U6.U5 tri-snRNP-associated protein 2 isoform X1 [Hemicordylus capensis]|uniref:U4/U6.U5 tri-snRNP-associated protein 2 isoform X1 n=1 Tax=Hemicordylus capensis TaxID=884348 RepID=UPI002302C0FB|nr:U4/U6.U5 tri-snRNP-associated protein 2 isoform X1 [Hemicordylus capensis]